MAADDIGRLDRPVRLRRHGQGRRSGMPHNASQWFAQRSVQGVGEDGAAERVTIWIERKPGAVWAVGRAVDLAQRTNGAIRDDDYVFEGFEMGDALEAANEALASD